MPTTLRETLPYITSHGTSAIITTPYNPRVVEIARSLNAKFEPRTKAWIVGPRKIGKLNAVHDEILAAVRGAEEEKRRADQARADQREKERAERQRQWAAERAEKRAEDDRRMQALRASRVIIRENTAQVGDLIKAFGSWREVESLGKSFRMSEDAASVGYDHSWVGQLVQYAYTRAADHERIAKHEADLAAQAEIEAAAHAKAAAQRKAIAAVASSGDAPALGSVPAGEEIWANRESALYGTTYRVILTEDGWLWHVVYDGSDGAAWGDLNLGYNTRGARLAATPELIAAIRGE